MHNVGKIDRLIRIGIAVVLLVLYFTHVLESKFFLFLPFVLIFTSLNRCCPLSALLGLGTCGVEVEKSETTIETEQLKLKK